MSKIGIWATGTLLVLMVLTAVPGAVVTPGTKCADGTVWGQCSGMPAGTPGTPGMVCWADSSSPTGVSLISVYSFPPTADVRSKCACSKFPGYTLIDNTCVKTVCDDPNGQTIQTGACASTPPQQCVSGQLIKNSTQCGCQAGYKPAADGRNCDPRVGCRWGTKICQPNQDCKYDNTNAQDDGTCASKPGCVYTPELCDSTQDCVTTTNATGTCVTKKGCTYDNPKCASDESCVTNVCQKKAAGVPLANLTTANATTSGGLDLSKICPCCPAPAAGAAAMVGLVSYRKWKGRKEEKE